MAATALSLTSCFSCAHLPSGLFTQWNAHPTPSLQKPLRRPQSSQSLPSATASYSSPRDADRSPLYPNLSHTHLCSRDKANLTVTHPGPQTLLF